MTQNSLSFNDGVIVTVRSNMVYGLIWSFVGRMTKSQTANRMKSSDLSEKSRQL